MFKHLLIATICMSASIRADWIDDMSVHAHGKKLEQAKAVHVIEDYIRQEEQTIADLEKQMTGNSKSGVVAGVRDGAYKVRKEAAKKRLNDHKKVLKFLNSLPRNEKDREKFAEHLSNIRVTQEELADLKEEASKTGTLADAAKNTVSIAKKEGYVKLEKMAIEKNCWLSS